MKYVLFICCAAGLLFTQVSCKKTVENAVDCFAESLLVSVSGTTDTINIKKMNFEARYLGSHTVKNVEWNFGDGATAIENGTTTSHVYSSPGTYKAKAKINIVDGKSTCSPVPEKDITIN